MQAESRLPPDRLNEIGVLKRREVEARLVGPLLEALGKEFGRERVLEVARQVIIRVAHAQGAELAQQVQGTSLERFAAGLDNWKKDDAMQIDVLEQSETRLSFNVTRCRYAEMYQALEIPELGALFSCNRDQALIEGFNADITLERTQTIMEGAPHCDFRYRWQSPAAP